MQNPPLFGEVLEAIGQLTTEEQEALSEIVRKRLAERGRKRVVAEAHEARREFEAGNFRSGTVDELMDEILS